MNRFSYSDTGTFLAGGTTLVDPMKLGVSQPDTIVDLSGQPSSITLTEDALTIEAGATMADVASHPDVAERFPVVAQALLQAASPQIRNMATIGGNLLQRTRCSYFRDTASACNKRSPGAGCAAIGGEERSLSVLGRSSSCIANYPGDLAVALVALGAEVHCRASDGTDRVVPIADLHTLPGNTPHIEHTLRDGERIASVRIPNAAWSFSTYVKLRDRASYAFALSSAALCVKADAAGQVTAASLALGGMVAKPWLCDEAVEQVIGRGLSEDLAADVAAQAYQDADGDPKLIAVGKAAIRRALAEAACALQNV